MVAFEFVGVLSRDRPEALSYVEQATSLLFGAVVSGHFPVIGPTRCRIDP
jgi:hypothetical protein